MVEIPAYGQEDFGGGLTIPLRLHEEQVEKACDSCEYVMQPSKGLLNMPSNVCGSSANQRRPFEASQRSKPVSPKYNNLLVDSITEKLRIKKLKTSYHGLNNYASTPGEPLTSL